jgi:hypothetical protein
VVVTNVAATTVTEPTLTADLTTPAGSTTVTGGAIQPGGHRVTVTKGGYKSTENTELDGDGERLRLLLGQQQGKLQGLLGKDGNQTSGVNGVPMGGQGYGVGDGKGVAALRGKGGGGSVAKGVLGSSGVGAGGGGWVGAGFGRGTRGLVDPAKPSQIVLTPTVPVSSSPKAEPPPAFKPPTTVPAKADPPPRVVAGPTPTPKPVADPEPVVATGTTINPANPYAGDVGGATSTSGTGAVDSLQFAYDATKTTGGRYAKNEEGEESNKASKTEPDDDFDSSFGSLDEKKGKTKSGGYIPPAPGSSGGDVKESLGQSDVMEVLLANRAALGMCVQMQKKSDPSLSGRLLMKWTILASGKTANVSVASKEHERMLIATCVGNVIKGMLFPASKAPYTITFPFKF